jgi:hypothetical protein
MVEKWQALESMLRTHTSCPRFCIKNHPEDEMQPKTIMEKNRVQTLMQTMGRFKKVRGKRMTTVQRIPCQK